MDNWGILGIEPTIDEEEIRKAYMVQLTQHHPEEDPEGFANLRSAYEAIIKELEEGNETPEEDNTPTGKWIAKVAECYEDYLARISEEAWQELLADEVCYALDEAEEASRKLLIYLMSHYMLPHNIWMLFDKTFHWEENHEALYEVFPAAFINFVRNGIKNEDNIAFQYVKPDLGVTDQEIDEWMKKYLNLNHYYNEDDWENIKLTLEELKKYDVYYPEVEAIEIYYLFHTGSKMKALEKSKAFLGFIAQHEDCVIVLYPIGKVLLEGGEVEEGLRLLNKRLEDNPSHYYTNLTLLKYYLKDPKEILKVEEIVKILGANYGSDEELKPYFKEASLKLIDYYEEQVNLEDEELKHQLAIYYAESSQIEKCHQLCLEILDKNPAYDRAYYTLVRTCMEEQRFEEALGYTMQWVKQEEREEKAIAYTMRSQIYLEINRYEEALEDCAKVIEYDPEARNAPIRRLYCLNKLERYSQLIDEAQALIDKGLKNSVTYYYLGVGYYYSKDYNEAMHACIEALRLNAYELEAYRIQAKIFFDVRQYEDVLDVLEVAKEYGLKEDEELMCFEVESLRFVNQIEKAEEVCERALELYKENDTLYYHYACIKDQMGDYEAAYTAIEKSIDLKPYAYKFYKQGCICMHKGAYERGIEVYKEALVYGKKEEMPPAYEADVLDNMGYIYSSMGELETAKSYYEQAIEKNPEHDKAYTHLAEYYENQNDYEKAISLYTKEIELEQDDYDYVGRGWCYIEIKDYEKARADFDEALRINENNAYAMNGIGCIYTRQDQAEEAEAYYKKAIELNSTFYMAYENLGYCLGALKRYEEAIEIFTKAIEMQPQREYLYIDRGNAYYRLEQYNQAIGEYCKAEEIDNENYWIYFYKARVYNTLEQYQEALENYKKVLKLNEGHIDTLWNMADIYNELREYEKAIECFDEVVRIQPDNQNAIYNQGYYYAKMHEPNKALEKYQKVLEIEPEDRDTLVGMGNQYMELKQYEKALEWYEKARVLYPDDSITYRKIGECYSEMRLDEKAISYLEKGIALNEEDNYARDILAFIYYHKQDYDAATKCFSQILERNEKYADAYRGLGLIAMDQKKYEEGYSLAYKALENSGLSYCYMDDFNHVVLDYEHHYEEALALYKRLYEENNKPARLGFYMGQILWEIGNQEEAKAYIQITIEALKEEEACGKANGCTYFHIGKCYRAIEDKENARRYYMKAILKGTNCWLCSRAECHEAHFALGELYEEEAENDAALEEYIKADKISGINSNYKEAVERMKAKGAKVPKKKKGLKALISEKLGL